MLEKNLKKVQRVKYDQKKQQKLKEIVEKFFYTCSFIRFYRFKKNPVHLDFLERANSSDCSFYRGVYYF